MAQWLKGLMLSLQWLGSLLQHGFNPWPRNFLMLWAWPKKKKVPTSATRCAEHSHMPSHLTTMNIRLCDGELILQLKISFRQVMVTCTQGHRKR